MSNYQVLKAEIKNFQNIDCKTVDIDGKSLAVIGKNGEGKSSFIRAIMSALNSKYVPSKAIKNGEERGSVELVVGNDNEVYNFDIYFSQEKQKGRIVVTDPEGATVKNRGVAESIIGNIGFDIMEFINLGMTKTGSVSKSGVKEQIDVLFQFLTEDQQKVIRDNQKDIASIKVDRTVLNKQIKADEVDLENNKFSEEELSKYANALPADEIEKKISEVNQKQMDYDRIERGVQEKNDRIQSINEELRKLEDEKNRLEKEVKGGSTWLSKNERPTTEDITKQLEEIREHNQKHEEIKRYAQKFVKLQIDKRDYKSKGDQVKKKEEEIANTFADSKLPVKNLTFDEDQVLYDGLPFNYDHHPYSRIMIVGAKIAMAMNPNLRTIFVNDGSLLDKDNLKLLVDLCEENDYQIMVEIVDFEGGDLKVEFTEKYLK